MPRGGVRTDYPSEVLKLLTSEDKYFHKRDLRYALYSTTGKKLSLASVSHLVGELRKRGHIIDCKYKVGYRYEGKRI